MKPGETILAIVDAQARHHAGLAKAALLAGKYGTRMDLLAGAGGSACALESLARLLRAHGLEVTTAPVLAEPLTAALTRRLSDQRTRFVIKDVVQNASSRRTALTPEECELVRACPVPLLLSKPTLWPELPQICAAIEPALDDEQLVSSDEWVLRHAALLAQQLAGQFRVVSIGSMGERGFARQQVASVVVMCGHSRGTVRTDVDGPAEGLLSNIPCDVLVVNASPEATLLH